MLSELEVIKIIEGTKTLIANTIKSIEDNSSLISDKEKLPYFDKIRIATPNDFEKLKPIMEKLVYLGDLQDDLNTFRYIKEGRQYKGDRRYDID